MTWVNSLVLGGGIGAFIGIFIAVLMDLTLAEAAYRTAVWFGACGLLGVLLHFLVQSFDD